MLIGVAIELVPPAPQGAVIGGKQDHQNELGVKPAVLRPIDNPKVENQDEAEAPSRQHGGRGDGPKQPAFHHLEGLGLLGARLGERVIDIEPRQVKQPRHPGNHCDQVKRLYNQIESAAVHSSTHPSTA